MEWCCDLVLDAARTLLERPAASPQAVMRVSTVEVLVIDGFLDRLLECVCFGHLR
jgi:hypothetical protein